MALLFSNIDLSFKRLLVMGLSLIFSALIVFICTLLEVLLIIVGKSSTALDCLGKLLILMIKATGIIIVFASVATVVYIILFKVMQGLFMVALVLLLLRALVTVFILVFQTSFLGFI